MVCFSTQREDFVKFARRLGWIEELTLKSAFRWTEEAQADEDLLSRLNAPAGEWRPFDKQPSHCFSVPEVAAQRGEVVSFSVFWSFGADDQGRGAAVASAALRGPWRC